MRYTNRHFTYLLTLLTLAVDGWAVIFANWYSEEGPGRSAAPPSPLLAVPNVTASVPITVLLYDGPLLCCFNAAIKGLNNVCGRQKLRRSMRKTENSQRNKSKKKVCEFMKAIVHQHLT